MRFRTKNSKASENSNILANSCCKISLTVYLLQAIEEFVMEELELIFKKSKLGPGKFIVASFKVFFVNLEHMIK